MNKEIIFKDAQENIIEYNGEEITNRIGCYGIILNMDNEILLIKNKNRKGWLFPGGGLEIEESFEECVQREVLEEVGFKVSVDSQPLCVNSNYTYFRNKDIYIKKIDLLFLCSLKKNEKFSEYLEENEGIVEEKWFSIEEFEECELMWQFENVKQLILQLIDETELDD